MSIQAQPTLNWYPQIPFQIQRDSPFDNFAGSSQGFLDPQFLSSKNSYFKIAATLEHLIWSSLRLIFWTLFVVYLIRKKKVESLINYHHFMIFSTFCGLCLAFPFSITGTKFEFSRFLIPAFFFTNIYLLVYIKNLKSIIFKTFLITCLIFGTSVDLLGRVLAATTQPLIFEQFSLWINFKDLLP